MPGERGDHCVARFVRCAHASESGRFESISASGGFLLQICGLKSLTIHNDDFRRAAASLPQPGAITNGRYGPNFADVS